MDINRWKNFSKHQQLLMIGSELMRAKTWQGRDQEKFLSALERALELIDLTISDIKWRNNLQMMLDFRNVTAEFFCFKRSDDISLLYNAL